MAPVATRVLYVCAGIAGLAVFVAASGLLPVSATGWPWTDALQQFVSRQSIALRASTIDVPQLDGLALVQRGAGHYETVCRDCHGAPGGPPLAGLRNMHPQPPDLLRVGERYSEAELFQIVKHGIRFTGMPAWPAKQRDDEVWAMVALLGALPELGPAGYAAMALPPPGDATSAAPAIVIERCVRCHGADGNGRGTGAFPVLAGQHDVYLLESLRAFALGARHSGIMSPVAARLSADEARAAAAYYGSLPGLSAGPRAAIDAEGASIVHVGAPEKRVPSCMTCHGHAGANHNPSFPVLGGQYPGYLALQLELFATRSRGGTAFAHVMYPAADGLSEHQRVAAAEYFGRPRMTRAEGAAP